MAWSQDVVQGVSKNLSLLFAAIDAGALCVAGIIAYYLRFQHGQIESDYYAMLAVSVLVNYAVFSSLHVYQLSTRVSFIRHFMKLMRGCVGTALFLMLLAFLFKLSAHYSRIWFITWMGCYFLLLILNRYLLFTLFDVMRAKGINQRRVAIIGCNTTSETLVQRLDKSLWTGYKITHLWNVSPGEKIVQFNAQHHVTDIPTHLPLFVKKHQIDEIWLVLSLKEMDTIRSLMLRFRELAIPIRMMLNAEEFAFFEYTITDIAGFPALNLNASPIQVMNRLLKECEDRLLALGILFIIWPDRKSVV